MLRSLVFGVSLLVTVVVAGCSSDASSPSTGTVNAGGSAGFSATGGAPSGGGVNASGQVAAGGAPVAAGQLVCGGKLCHAGGACDKTGACPAFLGDCFGSGDHVDTCVAYCSAHGFTCAPRACGPDGNAYAGSGFTWTSYGPAQKATCMTSQGPDHEGVDACGTVVFLALPADEVVRCCCAG